MAEVSLNLGYQISGSGLKLSPTTERLSKLGARIYEGHSAANISCHHHARRGAGSRISWINGWLWSVSITRRREASIICWRAFSTIT